MTDNEPKAYIPAPTPPAAVKDSGIGTAPIVPEERGFVSLSPYDRQLLSDLKSAADLKTPPGQTNEWSTLEETLAAQKVQILARFERRNLAPETISAIERMTGFFRDQAEDILDSTKPGREQSAALTALEEAKFWTNQSIALNGEAA